MGGHTSSVFTPAVHLDDARSPSSTDAPDDKGGDAIHGAIPMETSRQDSFPKKLHSLLSDTRNAKWMGWSRDGTSFSMINASGLSSEVIAKHFKTTKFSSLHRQLTNYGFTKKNRRTREQTRAGEVNACEFFHPCFQRDRPDLLPSVCPVKSKKPGLPPPAVFASNSTAKSELTASSQEVLVSGLHTTISMLLFRQDQMEKNMATMQKDMEELISVVRSLQAGPAAMLAFSGQDTYSAYPPSAPPAPAHSTFQSATDVGNGFEAKASDLQFEFSPPDPHDVSLIHNQFPPLPPAISPNATSPTQQQAQGHPLYDDNLNDSFNLYSPIESTLKNDFISHDPLESRGWPMEQVPALPSDLGPSSLSRSAGLWPWPIYSR